MTVIPRRKSRPAWLFRQLTQGRFILRLCLAALLLILFLGFAGALEGGLSAIDAGHTGLAYSAASMRNGARLTPIDEEAPYRLFTTADATLQNYFSLDTQTGALFLRDGIRSRSFLTNPLSTYPLMIASAPSAAHGPGPSATKVISLYVHLVDCDRFLSEYAPANRMAAPQQVALSEADRVLQCMRIPPVIQRASTLGDLQAWIKASSTGLLGAQRDAYLREAEDILGMPKYLADGWPPPYAWDQRSAAASPDHQPVWRLFVLEDKVNPGMRIFPVDDGIHSSSPPPRTAVRKPLAAPETGAGALLRSIDQIFLLILQLRYPVLIFLGILLPLLALLLRQRDVVVRRCLIPYLLLLLAQLATLFVAEALIGEGLMIWVSFIFTLLRIAQLVGLLQMSVASDSRLRRLFDLRPLPWLRRLLRFELLLWSINALGLGWHILGVFREFSYISPA